MPVINPMSVPIIVVAVVNALLLLKNDTIKQTIEVFAIVVSKIRRNIFKQLNVESQAPPFATI